MPDISLMSNMAVLTVLGEGAWHSIQLETEGWGDTESERGTDRGGTGCPWVSVW